MSPNRRSHLAIGLPMLLILVVGHAIGPGFGEPEMAKSWSDDAKAFALFIVAMSALACLSIGSDLWATWIDPHGLGRNRQAVARLIDNAGTLASIAVVVPLIVYSKSISLWPYLAVIALCGLLPIARALSEHRKINGQDK